MHYILAAVNATAALIRSQRLFDEHLIGQGPKSWRIVDRCKRSLTKVHGICA